MPTFDSPRPVHARIDVSGGTVHVRASVRPDTVVDVRPSNPGSSGDVQLAAQTRVEHSDGRVVITSPRRQRLLFFGTMPSVDITVLVPEGSGLQAISTAGDVDCEGRLGDVRVETRYGDVRIERAAGTHVRTSAGGISVGAADGDCDVATSYGPIRVGRGGGDLRLDSAYGDVDVTSAAASVTARTKYGDVRVHEAVRGELDLQTGYGSVEAGVRDGTAAWLDVASGSGRVRNLLTESDSPGDSSETLSVRARTAHGSILVRRA